MGNDQEEAPESPEVDFEPIMKLPLVETKTLEEDEEELVKLRAKLFRYDKKDVPAEWKERGTGEVKILKHKDHETVRVVMRRDKTLKICANHYIQPFMEVHFKSGSDKALVWSTPADYADEEPKPELLAIKFATAENCLKFKEAFEKGISFANKKQADSKNPPLNQEKEKDVDEVTKVVDELSLTDQKGAEKGGIISEAVDSSDDFPADVEEDIWKCSSCTFLNHPAVNKCEICEMERSSSSASKSKEALKEETLSNSTSSDKATATDEK